MLNEELTAQLASTEAKIKEPESHRFANTWADLVAELVAELVANLHDRPRPRS